MPSHDTNVRAQLTHFSLNYTFWLNLLFGALGALPMVGQSAASDAAWSWGTITPITKVEGSNAHHRG